MSELELERLNTGREPNVASFVTRMVNKLFRYGGQLGVNLIVAGYDSNGEHLCELSSTG